MHPQVDGKWKVLPGLTFHIKWCRMPLDESVDLTSELSIDPVQMVSNLRLAKRLRGGQQTEQILLEQTTSAVCLVQTTELLLRHQQPA